MQTRTVKLVPILVSMAILFFSLSASRGMAADYFPLAVGNTWVYYPSYGDGNRVDKIIGAQNINGTRTYIWKRTEQPPDNYQEKRWLANSGGFLKIYKFWGNEMPSPQQPVIIDPPMRDMKLNPKVGDKWKFELGLDGNLYRETCTVESTTARVKVRAGTFNNCMRLRVLTEHFENGVLVERKYKRRWYAPEVGPVLFQSCSDNWSSVYFAQKLIHYVIK